MGKGGAERRVWVAWKRVNALCCDKAARCLAIVWGRMCSVYATEEINVRTERLSWTRKHLAAAVMGGGKGGFSVAVSRDV